MMPHFNELMRTVSLVVTLAVFPAFAEPALAQIAGVAPPSNPIERTLPHPQPEVTPPTETPPEAEGPIAPGPEIKISSVEIVGATVYPRASIEVFLQGFAGTTVHTGSIVEAVRKIQAKYRADGYFLTTARAVITRGPDGAQIQVQVAEGYISDVKIDEVGDVGYVKSLVYSYLNHLPDIRPIRFADLEHYALLAQSIPGITIRTVLRASKEVPGTAELVAQVSRKIFDYQLTDDNRGSHAAGPNQLVVGFAANSLTSLGERTEVLVYDTPFNDEQLFGQASFEALLGSEGFKARAYAGYGLAEPGGVLAASGYRSRLLLGGFSGSYPLIRSRDLSVFLSGAFDIEQSEIDVLGFDGGHHRQGGSNSHLRVLRLSASVDHQDTWLSDDMAGVNTASLTIHRGVPELGGDSNGAPYQARPGERNDFLKISTELIRVQNLYSWNTDLLALKLAFAGQWTDDILPPAEKFFLGGNQYGRGFYSGEITGDRVAAGTIELQFNDPVETQFFGEAFNLGFQYYTFFDIGQTWDLAPGDPSHHVESAGGGLRLKVTENVSFQFEGLERFTRRPNGNDLVSRENGLAGFFSLVAQY